MELVEMATQIVTAQASSQAMSTEELKEAVKGIFEELKHCARGEMSPADSLAHLIESPHLSIKNDHILCLECGRKMKLLGNKHLETHNMTPTEYKIKYGIKKTTSLSSRNLTHKRKRQAIARGAGAGLHKWRKENGYGHPEIIEGVGP